MYLSTAKDGVKTNAKVKFPKNVFPIIKLFPRRHKLVNNL